MKILLVEDDYALAQGLQSALVREHFVVNWVSKGREALLVIATELPDIMILDIG